MTWKLERVDARLCVKKGKLDVEKSAAHVLEEFLNKNKVETFIPISSGVGITDNDYEGDHIIFYYKK